ncbi:MAG TPA: hypothetical protein VMF14_18955 [Solirubrobacteraceae bacterium]|nr:hypothetical protein [Solirubrobacteraceae bacterium]
MLLSDDRTQPFGPASAGDRHLTPAAQLATAPSAALPPEAVPHLLALRAALARYRVSAAPGELSGAFPAAGAMIGAMVSTVDGRPELEQLRRLADTLPEFGELLSAAAAQAERVVCAGTVVVWQALGLRSTAPSWSPTERDAARMVFACACSPALRMDPVRFQAGLRAVAAPRFAELLCRELAESEEAWTRALGDRYESVRHRCARRTTWRSLGLSDLLRGDERSRHAVTRRLERWMGDGGLLPTLAAELEAAIVHARTPARFA